MLARGEASVARFSATFPQRFAAALAEARGTIAGIAASADERAGGLIDADSLRRLHEIYRLRVELEIETAGVLWRTAEVVCAMADAIEVLSRRRLAMPAPPQPWLGAIAPAEIEARREGSPVADGPGRRRERWPEFGAPGSGDFGDGRQRNTWPPRRIAEEDQAEAA